MGERFSVLVVDDEPSLLSTIEAVLDGHVDVTTTASPHQALRLLDEHSFHVVCADYQMPLMNGLQLLERVALRAEPVSCLLVTGANEYLRREGKTGHYVLLKPFAPDRLVAMVLQLARVAHMKRTVNALVDKPTGRFAKAQPR